jgi:DNA polymerase III delta prime subunit
MTSAFNPKTRQQLDALTPPLAMSVIISGANDDMLLLAAREMLNRHPADAEVIIDKGTKASIGIETIRDLKRQLNLAPRPGNPTRPIFIVGAERLTAEASNALLKLLEEPPPATLIALLTTHPQTLLATIRSRCRHIRVELKDPSSHVDLSETQADLNGFLGASIYHRLLQAKVMAPQLEPRVIIAQLRHICRTEYLSQPTTERAAKLEHQLSALHRYSQRCSAGVAARPALEVLGLEL